MSLLARQFYLDGMEQFSHAVSGEFHAKRTALMSMVLGWDLGLFGYTGGGKTVLANAIRDLCTEYREDNQTLSSHHLISSALAECRLAWERDYEPLLLAGFSDGGEQFRGSRLSEWCRGITRATEERSETISWSSESGFALADADILGVWDKSLLVIDFVDFFSPQALAALGAGLQGAPLGPDHRPTRPKTDALRQIIAVGCVQNGGTGLIPNEFCVGLGARMGERGLGSDLDTMMMLDRGRPPVEAITSIDALDTMLAELREEVVIPAALALGGYQAGSLRPEFVRVAQVAAAFTGATTVSEVDVEVAYQSILLAYQFRDVVRPSEFRHYSMGAPSFT